ncbi:MAG: type II secretion system inner membrane protein GspF [Betaproteobacteria bacterium]|nr:type II secretion system inner membrane protein GspF [Betaproteobacteria bacterium]
MAGFKYEAVGDDGHLVKGVLEADTPRQARLSLRARGLTAVSLDTLSGGASRTWRAGPGAAQLNVLTRELATLLNAGLTVEQTLTACIEHLESHAVRQLLAAIRADVLAGLSFGQALAKQPRSFPAIYLALVDSGERSGQLGAVMLRLADYLDNRQRLRQKVGLAFVYPAIVTTVAVLVVGGLLTYVVPQIAGVFEDSGQPLPWLTRALIALSQWLAHAWPVLFALAALAALAVRRALKEARWRRFAGERALRLPVLGRMVRAINTARFAASLAILVGSGVPLLSALDAAAAVVGNVPMRLAAEEAMRKVREGVSLARALSQSGLFPPMMIHLVASGETSGQLAAMLDRVASQQALEVEGRISMLVTLLEPALILAMGATVLVIVLAILLPIFDMNQLVH